jgi:hypothetical protein
MVKILRVMIFYRDFLDGMFPGIRRRDQIKQACQMIFGPNFLGIMGEEIQYNDRTDGWTVRAVCQREEQCLNV